MIIGRADGCGGRLGFFDRRRRFSSYRAPADHHGARMSIKLMTRVWEELLDLRGTKLNGALALADWARDDGTKIYPSMKTFAHKVRISERDARRIIREFEKSGLLTRVRSGRGRGNHAEWRMNLQVPENRTKTSGFEVGKTGQIEPENRTERASKTGQNGSNPGAPITIGSVRSEPSRSSAVDKSTVRTRTRKCTHGKCGPGECSYLGGADTRTLARIDFNRALEDLGMKR